MARKVSGQSTGFYWVLLNFLTGIMAVLDWPWVIIIKLIEL